MRDFVRLVATCRYHRLSVEHEAHQVVSFPARASLCIVFTIPPNQPNCTKIPWVRAPSRIGGLLFTPLINTPGVPRGYLPILRPVAVSDDLPTYLPTYQLLPPSQRPPRAAVRLPAQLLLLVAGHDHGVRPHLAAIPRAMVQPPALRHRPPHS